MGGAPADSRLCGARVLSAGPWAPTPREASTLISQEGGRSLPEWHPGPACLSGTVVRPLCGDCRRPHPRHDEGRGSTCFALDPGEPTLREEGTFPVGAGAAGISSPALLKLLLDR